MDKWEGSLDRLDFGLYTYPRLPVIMFRNLVSFFKHLVNAYIVIKQQRIRTRPLYYVWIFLSAVSTLHDDANLSSNVEL